MSDEELWKEPPPMTDPIVTPPGTPEELHLRPEAPKPLRVSQADLGTKLKGKAPDGRDRPHRLVVVGDSISQGFQSLAISKTELSWPAMVAAAMGFTFSYPVFPGPDSSPGLPSNLEGLFRTIESSINERPLPFDSPHAVATALRVLEEVRRYWESGPGNAPLGAQSSYFDNLAIWGWDVRDALSKSRQWCQDRVDEHTSLLNRLNVSHQLSVSHSNERSAVRTLWNSADKGTVTQMSAAQALGREGVDTLVVGLGANNALGTVGAMKIRWTQEDFQDIDKKSAYNLWTPNHFATELHELAAEVEKVDSTHTIWLTVPHVTIVPILRGVGEKPYYSRYYSRYTRPWIPDSHFDADLENFMTGDDARMIDAAIDQYNWAIKGTVHAARERGLDWAIVDMCGLLDRLAYKRYTSSPGSQPEWWAEVATNDPALPSGLLRISPRPDTRFYLSDKAGRTQGGLIALDGVHPTTIGYGLIADQVLRTMVEVLGVKGATPHPQIDFRELLEKDTLLSHPLTQLNEDGTLIGLGHRLIDVVETLFGKSPV